MHDAAFGAKACRRRTAMQTRIIQTDGLKQRVLDIFDLLFKDTVKARYLDKELSNRYVPRGNRRKVRAQMAIYDYLKSLEQPD